jgi:fructose-bisphosphate aldolase class II
MHGMLASMVEGTTKKHLDIARIAQIKGATGALITLHGASGTDDEDLRKAIAAGINVVHINTELRVAWRRGLEEGLVKFPNEVVPYKILPLALEAIQRTASSLETVQQHELRRRNSDEASPYPIFRVQVRVQTSVCANFGKLR